MANLDGNNFWEGALGVVQLDFDGVDLGKTGASTTLEYIEDITDIFYQQDGTQPADKYRTGAAWQVTASFAQIDTELVTKLFAGTTRGGSGNNSIKLSRELYRSMLTNEAKVLIVKRVDSEGDLSTDHRYWTTFYKAVPLVTGGTFEYGADTQKMIEITFYCFYDTTNNAFGYSGYATSLGL